MKKDYICIVCPKGCKVSVEDGKITGYSCIRGLNYIKQESVNPMRVVTSTFRVDSKENVVCPCKTKEPVPKGQIMNIIKEINKLKVKSPIHIGDVIIANVCDTGADIVATKEIK